MLYDMRWSAWFVYLLVIMTSCVVDIPDLSRYVGSGIENVEVATDIELTYTDSSHIVFTLKAPLLKRLYSKFSVTEEFPEGIEVAFYDPSGQPRSWLTADYATRDQANRKITVRKNVVLRNDLGERMEGPELIWDEKAKEITTDRFVRITKADGSVIYSYGFKSNESFTRYELQAVSGDMYIKQMESEE